jgi:hypothetical protein
LARKRSVSSSQSESQTSLGRSNESSTNKTIPFSGLSNPGTSLALALQNSRRSTKLRTSFVRSQSSQSGNSSSDVVCSSFNKNIAFNHIVFHSISESQSQLSKSQLPQSSNLGSSYEGNVQRNSSLPAHNTSTRSDSFTSKRKSRMSSLFEQTVVNGFHKRKRT